VEQDREIAARQPETASHQAPSPTGPAASAPPATAPLPAPAPQHADAMPEPGATAQLLHLILRSTPAGATIEVDGRPVGITPTAWDAPVTERPREFVFALPGHVTARYRFVPIRDGVVHATLHKIAAAARPAAAPSRLGTR
jgi:hypothetical protein